MRITDIKGFNNYQITDDGRVWSNKQRKQWLKIQCGENGYKYVLLWDNNKRINKLIHILLAEAFIPNPHNYDNVHHKDKNPNNNDLSNLEWIDSKKHKELHNKEHSKNVYQYTLNGDLVKVWNSVNECERNGGFNKGHIAACCRGVEKQHKGFLWSYQNTLK